MLIEIDSFSIINLPDKMIGLKFAILQRENGTVVEQFENIVSKGISFGMHKERARVTSESDARQRDRKVGESRFSAFAVCKAKL